MSNILDSWDVRYQNKNLVPKYPSESVVRFMHSFFPLDIENRSKIKILDVGCGGGRHLKLFAENGFQTYGIDISQEIINYAECLMKKNHLKSIIKKSEMNSLDFESDYFDAVISFGVFYYSDSVNMKKCISELYRVLKKDGKGFINLRTTYDYRYGKGAKIEDNTFKINVKETNELNLLIHFLSKKDVYDYFSKFTVISLEKNEFTKNNLSKLNSDWLITVKK